jgi:hypothetical protein
MFAFDPARYPPSLSALLTPERLPELGPGKPNETARSALTALTPESAFPNLRDRSMALACISGLWLLHDFLDESHAISQELDSPTGSYWHGIMHRREPDAGNAKYWFRRIGTHAIFPALSDEAALLGYADANKPWNPSEFIDCCEADRDTGSGREMVLRRVQLLEIHLLFDWCWRKTVEV